MISFSKKLSNHFRSGSFLRHLAILGSGTALAQAIPILASPILTRLYSPDDFAMLAIFMAVVGIFTPIICGKYEVALVLPKSQVQAQHLLGIALYFTFIISLILAIAFAFSGPDLLSFLHADKLGRWIFAVPVAMLLTGIFTAANYYANRNKDYSLMSKARVVRALLTTSIGIIAGILGSHFSGLLTGFFAGLACASGYIIIRYRMLPIIRLLKWSKAKKLLLCKYRQYPIYDGATGLLNGLTLSLPVIFLSRYFPESVVGYFSLVLRVSLTPVSFISASVSQINLKKVVDLINNGKSPIPFLLKLTALLTTIILVPSIVIIVWGPKLFALIFGSTWETAGEYARIMMPAIAIQFLVSTLSTTMWATNHTPLLGMWKLLSFIVTLIIFMWVSKSKDIFFLLHVFTAANIALYIIYYCAIIYSAKRPRNFTMK